MATATKQSAVKPKNAASKPAAKSTTKASVAKAAGKPAARGVKATAPARPAAPAQKAAAPKAKAPAAKKPAGAGTAPAKKAAPTPKKPAAEAVAKKVAVPAPKPAAKRAAVAKAATKTVAPPAPPAQARKTVSKPMSVSSKTSKSPAKKSVSGASGVLSEEALLKMPDKDYMNDAQLAFFRERLQMMKDEILVNARETGEHLKENEVFADPNDRATVEEENMLEQRVRDRERKLLKKIDASLRRIETGDYGYCLETGEPIGLPRLLARPTAELSIEAQEKHERRERLYAD